MNTKLGMLKQVVVAACFAASVGAFAIPAARAETNYSVSIGTPAYYGDYYYAPAYTPRCYYDYYGYYRCRPYYAYGGPYYYGPAISFGYYRGWYGWRGRDWDDRFAFRRWRR